MTIPEADTRLRKKYYDAYVIPTLSSLVYIVLGTFLFPPIDNAAHFGFHIDNSSQWYDLMLIVEIRFIKHCTGAKREVLSFCFYRSQPDFDQ